MEKKITLEEFLEAFSEYDSHYTNYFSKEGLITLYNNSEDWFFKDCNKPIYLVRYYAECPDWTWVKYYDEKNDTYKEFWQGEGKKLRKNWVYCNSLEDLKSRTKVFELSNSILIEEWARCVCTVKNPNLTKPTK